MQFHCYFVSTNYKLFFCNREFPFQIFNIGKLQLVNRLFKYLLNNEIFPLLCFKSIENKHAIMILQT